MNDLPIYLTAIAMLISVAWSSSFVFTFPTLSNSYCAIGFRCFQFTVSFARTLGKGGNLEYPDRHLSSPSCLNSSREGQYAFWRPLPGSDKGPHIVSAASTRPSRSLNLLPLNSLSVFVAVLLSFCCLIASDWAILCLSSIFFKSLRASHSLNVVGTNGDLGATYDILPRTLIQASYSLVSSETHVFEVVWDIPKVI